MTPSCQPPRQHATSRGRADAVAATSASYPARARFRPSSTRDCAADMFERKCLGSAAVVPRPAATRFWQLAAPDVQKMDTLLDLCVSSLRRGHANLLCIVPIVTDDPRRESRRELSLALKRLGAWARPRRRARALSFAPAPTWRRLCAGAGAPDTRAGK